MSSVAAAHSRSNSGFSVAELLIVLAIIALGASMTAAFIRPKTGTVSLRTTALQVAGHLRLVRSFAVLSAREAAAVLDLRHGRLSGDGLREPFQLPACVEATLTTAKLETQETTRAVIRFYADGSSSGGRMVLACDRQNETLTIDWLTGSVNLEARR